MVEERNSLVENNLGLVHSCAKKFCGRGIEYDDLFQAGCVGLVKASQSFDDTLGFAFSTYAVPAILGEIKRLFRDGGSVKVSRAIKERARQALIEKEKLALSLGYEPSISQLAKSMGLQMSEVAEILTAVLTPLSLTADFDDGENQIDLPVPSPEDELVCSMLVHELIDTLEPSDKRLIELRYLSGLTQSKTADILGMTQVQVSRREKSLLAIMRNRANK